MVKVKQSHILEVFLYNEGQMFSVAEIAKTFIAEHFTPLTSWVYSKHPEMEVIRDGEKYIPLDNPEMLVDLEAIELETLEKQARFRRDSLLKEVVDSMNPMRWEAMTELQKDAWRAYRQALLDVPQQEGFPEDIIWPNIPEA